MGDCEWYGNGWYVNGMGMVGGYEMRAVVIVNGSMKLVFFRPFICPTCA